ncbi:ABC transporter substrate-binding protein [Halomonas daqiaonensis]|uniref:NitT/TauT family transport system substrate-binding protein n=1 Tax=Halomonas daqiaonensis TaxID=650850 RepID=A0A1H7TH95_9GAMM|nr:ABC transporter substrate-binding protein [Halomonas daqiaonensis]SEL84191.1 NitT/TauT family transport system substrate-binding protein [Halomonas daqiaonensis]
MSDCCTDLRPMESDKLDIIHVSRGVDRRTLLKSMAGAAGLAALGDVSTVFGQDLKRIRLAFCSQLLCVVPYEATRAAGFFAEEGFDVELVYTRGGSAALQALNGGAVEYAATSFDAALNAFASGADIQRFASTGRLPLFALATSVEGADTITEISDLEGKTVGVSALGNADHAFLRYLLQRAGVDLDSVAFATVGTNLYDALRLGQLDAGMVQEPALSLLQERGARVLVNGMDIEDANEYLGGAYEFMGVAVRSEEFDERRDEMKRLARALAKGLRYVQEAEPEELVDALPREIITGGDREIVTKSLARYRSSLYPRDVELDLESMQRVIDVQKAADGRGGSVELEQIARPDLLAS